MVKKERKSRVEICYFQLVTLVARATLLAHVFYSSLNAPAAGEGTAVA